MKKKLRSAVERIFKIGEEFQKHNEIDVRMQERATDETCDYVEQHMMHLPACDTAFKVLDVALGNVSIKDGLYLEFGVFSGASINHVSLKATNKVHGFDSFEGLPEFWRDGFDKGFFNRDQSLPRVNPNVVLHKGWFNESLPPFVAANPEPVSFLHVDCDLYSSTVTIFENLDKQIVPGTIICFDEYFNYPGWKEGEFKAFKELVQRTGIKYEYLTYNKKMEQVAVRILEKRTDS
jgi:hypothetical protein